MRWRLSLLKLKKKQKRKRLSLVKTCFSIIYKKEMAKNYENPKSGSKPSPSTIELCKTPKYAAAVNSQERLTQDMTVCKANDSGTNTVNDWKDEKQLRRR
jgi:hypothetical protein